MPPKSSIEELAMMVAAMMVMDRSMVMMAAVDARHMMMVLPLMMMLHLDHTAYAFVRNWNRQRWRGLAT